MVHRTFTIQFGLKRKCMKKDDDLEILDLDAQEGMTPPQEDEGDEYGDDLTFEDVSDMDSSDDGDEDFPQPEAPRKKAAKKHSRRHHHNHKEEEPEDEENQEGGKFLPWYVHLIVLGAIILIAVIAVVRFVNWNKGEEIQIDPDAASMYNVEVNDNIVFLSDSALEGKTDDGVTTVLCLGNAPFSDDTTESGLAGQISALSGVTTINAAFPNSQVTCLNAVYKTDTQEDIDDVFNLFYVAYDISIGDFSNLETASAFHTDDPQYAAAVEALQSVDFSSLDYIAIMYDAADYENGMAMYNDENADDLTCYVGSLSNALQLIQDKYPWISIVFMSPTYVEHDNGDGTYSDARTLNLGNGTLNQYWEYAYDTCGELGVSFLDNYYGSINDSNFEEYLEDDHFHINAAGRTKIADHFVYKVINGTYSEYNADALMVAGSDSAQTAASE